MDRHLRELYSAILDTWIYCSDLKPVCCGTLLCHFMVLWWCYIFSRGMTPPSRPVNCWIRLVHMCVLPSPTPPLGFCSLGLWWLLTQSGWLWLQTSNCEHLKFCAAVFFSQFCLDHGGVWELVIHDAATTMVSLDTWLSLFSFLPVEWVLNYMAITASFSHWQGIIFIMVK
jgi:hypothetical protein